MALDFGAAAQSLLSQADKRPLSHKEVYLVRYWCGENCNLVTAIYRATAGALSFNNRKNENVATPADVLKAAEAYESEQLIKEQAASEKA